MSADLLHKQPEQTPALLLSAREAARRLAVSEKTLWLRTHPRGPIPFVRIGARRLYAVVDLETFIASARQGGVR